MPSQPHPQTRGEPLDYPAADIVGEAYVARPAAAAEGARLPCVLVAHAWDGLNEPIRAVAERVAALGHVAFALDAYGKGVRGQVDGDNSHLMMPLLQDRALLVLTAPDA